MQRYISNSILMVCLIMVTMLISTADATIISGSVTGGSAYTNGGIFQELFPPIGNVGQDNFQSNNLFAFNEDQNIPLGLDIDVNIGSGSLTSLPSGTVVASHYIFFDPGPSRRLIGNVEFDSEVLAIMTSRATLAASDYLANVSANYLSPSMRGLESGDKVTIDAIDSSKINIDFTASSPGDYIRVLTAYSPGAATVPEPGMMLLLGSGLAGLILFRKRFMR